MTQNRQGNVTVEDETERNALQRRLLLLPFCVAVFSLSALFYYHLRQDVIAVQSPLQVAYSGIYRVFGFAPSASAHDPIFLADEQITPDIGPFLPDGAISWALYGTFQAAGETRGFEFDLRDGDELFISLLIPNLEPELSLATEELPYLELTLPDGTVRMLGPVIREVFDEQFSRTSYVTLNEQVEPGIAGRHSVLVHSRAPARFTVAVGQREEFFTPADRTVDRPSSFLEISEPLNTWYQTPPGATTPLPVDRDEGVDVDVEIVESELERMAEEAAAEQDEAPIGLADEGGDVAGSEPGDEVSEVAKPVATEGSDDDQSGGSWILPVALVSVAVGAGVVMYWRRGGLTSGA